MWKSRLVFDRQPLPHLKGITSLRLRPCLEAAHDVSGPGSASDQGQDQQHAHGQVLERVRQAARDGVHRRARAGVDAHDSPQHDWEGDEQDQDDQARHAHGEEALEVADADLPGVLEPQEGKRDRAEGRHDVELDGSRPADDEGDDVGHQHHKPADEGDDEHCHEGRHVVLGGDDGDLGEAHGPARSEESLYPVDRKSDDLVDRGHDVEAVLDEEQEHGEEHEQEHDLLDARHALVAVHALGDLDELQGEHQAEDAASDGEYRHLPGAPGDVVHGDVARALEHRGEGGVEDSLVSDRAEDAHLRVEHPVAPFAEKVAEPRVDVVGDRRVGVPAWHEREDQEGQGDDEGELELPLPRYALDRRDHRALSSLVVWS